MANKAFASTDSQLAAMDDPITPADFKTGFDNGEKLLWYELAPGYGYDPYLVQVSSQSGATLRFFFIDCATGAKTGSEHSIRLSDHKLVHSESPATLPSNVDLTEGRVVGFLMLNPRELVRAGLQNDASLSNTDSMTASGKWPGTASSPMEFFALMKKLRKAESDNRQLRQRNVEMDLRITELAQDAALPQGVRDRLAALMGER